MNRWFNFPLELLSPTGELYRPTRVSLPAWITPSAQAEGERNHSIAGIVTRWITREFDLARLDLARSPLFPHLPLALDAAELLPRIKADVPVDAVEVVDWMQECAAGQAILSARVAEYNRHSRVVARSGDPASPGVRLEDISIVRVAGYGLVGGTFAVRTPPGSFSAPEGGGGAGIFSNLLAWAGGKSWGSYQWYGDLIKWLDLAKTPITRGIGFPSFRGIQAPNFFTQEPNRDASRVRNRIRIASDRDQVLHLTFRSPSDYTRVIDSADVNVGRGETDLEFIVASYPSVPVAVNQIQPSGGTVLRRYESEAE